MHQALASITRSVLPSTLHLRRLIALAATAGLTLAAGCRSREGAAEGDGPYAARVRESVAQIEKQTGLKFKRPPVLEVRSKEQVRQFLLARFEEQSPASELAAEEQVFKTLGLIPPTLDYRKFLLDLLSEQVVGYYDPRKDVLYVVEGGNKESAGITIAHELVHALQDQYIDLDSLQNLTGDVDRALAMQSVLEGQATYEQMSAMVGGESNLAVRLPGGWDQIRQTIRESQSEMPLFANAPLVIQESLLFPYLSGADFIRRFKGQKGQQNPLLDLPVSSEQVLHTRAFFSAQRDVPSRVTLPAPLGEKVYENTIGEFGTRIFLYQHTDEQTIALQGAMGWDGDRYVLTRSPAGNAIAWVSVWDSPVDAAEFSNAMSETVLQRYGGTPAAAAGAGTGPRRYSGRGRTVEIHTREIAGRTVVMYVDVPDGQPTAVIDFAKVTVEAR